MADNKPLGHIHREFPGYTEYQHEQAKEYHEADEVGDVLKLVGNPDGGHVADQDKQDKNQDDAHRDIPFGGAIPPGICLSPQ